MEKIKIVRINPKAILPQRATPGSAGMDLYACIDMPIVVSARGKAIVPTGISISLPSSDYVALIFARSGLAMKRGLSLINGVGVIDSDYIGEIKVGLINQCDSPYTVASGERIAQMIIAPAINFDFEEVDSLEETDRGDGGFGSTGRL